MVQEIRDIRFNHIRELALDNNRIESIEQLNWIWMPTLYRMNINRNFVIRVGTVRKLYCPSLMIINLCSSFVTKLIIQ